MKHFTLILLLTFAAGMILFVFVPLSYMALGKMENPLAIKPISAFDDQNQLFGGRAGATNQTLDCTDPIQSLEEHVRDAHLSKDGDESIVSSDFYKLNIVLEKPVEDWQYTKGALEDEVASFVYDDAIVHILARSAVSKCNSVSSKIFDDFHKKTSGVEYFSSRIYLNQGKSIGLTRSTLRLKGEGSIGGEDYFWYMLDEEFHNVNEKPVVTIWYSTRIGRTEYWFAFTTFKGNEGNLNSIATDILENTKFRKF